MIINPYAFGTAATDPSFASVISLVHFDGTGGSTGPFTDQIANRSPGWTRHGIGPQLSTTRVKFGSTSLNSGGWGVYNADHADWAFGSGDFTIEFFIWVYTSTSPLGNGCYIYDKTPGGYGPFTCIMATDRKPTFYASNDGASWGVQIVSATAFDNDSAWNHVAFTRSGNDFRAFIDGTQVGSTATMSGSLTTNTDLVSIGNYSGGTLNFAAQAYFDEWRVTKGVARYTANFTAPTAAFPDS